MLEAYHAIPQPPPPQTSDDPIESIIMAIMEWSDATHLAQFGTASLWPGYTFFSNHPKDFHGKPTSKAGFHQAYFASVMPYIFIQSNSSEYPQLPDTVRDSYRQQYGCDMPDEVYTHLKRELMHSIWELLLSEDFMDAYDNGIKIKCWDGIVRLVFPRFLYTGLITQRILLATIKSLGGRPCPRCFVEKKQISETGTVNDMKRRAQIRIDDHPRRMDIESARKAIFGNGNSLKGPSLNAILKKNSWVPTRNAFSKLDTIKTPFNLFTMFVPDLLHEVELGVAKAIIVHLICMLHSLKKTDEFDQRLVFYRYIATLMLTIPRFRQIPTFGRATICSFSHNVSELKHVAARDYEDILQCLLPVIEGLVPSHQGLIDKLCFELALWHGYAKLRMHTTSSIKLFRMATTNLCSTIRRFARETADIKTYELPRRRTSKG
ncbi:hypothetical protein MIND_01245000 [Mycena indigotica]|uniref:Uncharacterized protein n=1 Tax=Mycena indigotica TaxID=2126181 RepID=A0A8H6S4A9_9AGAR|nr:uncharacterized protein MIND_01245000 [Mycena indigotica]KAF7292177.1 hypothetical protein MIND_01245000 [Mycena indigotica]